MLFFTILGLVFPQWEHVNLMDAPKLMDTTDFSNFHVFYRSSAKNDEFLGISWKLHEFRDIQQVDDLLDDFWKRRQEILRMANPSGLSGTRPHEGCSLDTGV